MTIHEYSFGIIPLRQDAQGNWEILLVQHHAGHWAFPKGHAEPNESPQQTAERELQEETGLSIKRYLSDKSFQESYFFFFNKQRIHKTVLYFIAEVKGKIALQHSEIKGSRWIPLEQAANHITFKEGKNLCEKIQDLLDQLKS